MDELWTIGFSVLVWDVIESDTPSVDGEMLVRGYDILDVLEKARKRLQEFGYDRVIINGAWRYGFEKKGAKENE